MALSEPKITGFGGFDCAWGDVFCLVEAEDGEFYRLNSDFLRELVERHIVGRRIVSSDPPTKRACHPWKHVTKLEEK